MGVAVRFLAAVSAVAVIGACGTAVEPASEEPAAAPAAPSLSSSAPVASSSSAAAPPGPTAKKPKSTKRARPAAGKRWRPTPGRTWQWQLSTPVDLNVDADIYDIDGFSNDAGVVRELHRRGRKVICYVEVGAAENFRPDYRSWPAGLLGKENGWPGERWLDIRDPQRLAPILRQRFDMCRDKGFDAIEPDLMEHYTADTGFPITAAHQLRFNRFVARLAHERGLAVGLKNDLDQIPELVGDFDFAVNEECAAFDECAALTPFIAAGKAVLHAEYDVAPGAYCALTLRLRLSSIHKNKSLNAARTPC
jgi:hypothetical protein